MILITSSYDDALRQENMHLHFLNIANTDIAISNALQVGIIYRTRKLEIKQNCQQN